MKPEPPARKTGKKVAVVGSGPAGLACAQQLARAGHEVHVFEKNAKPGGLLRYGIPDFKMEKHLIDRRVEQMKAEGVAFHCGVHVGVDIAAERLIDEYDAVALAGGAEKPRDLPMPGRELSGIHFAMDFLPQQNRRVAREPIHTNEPILAGGKHVVVIGGGDTGSDCIGTSIRQGALSVTQLEIMPEPPEKENKLLTWPDWPLKLRTSSAMKKAPSAISRSNTVNFCGENGGVKKLDVRARRRQVAADSRHRIRAEGRSRAARHGLRLAGARGTAARSRRRVRSSAAMSPPIRSPIDPRSRRCSPAATCAAASRWSSGRSAKAANAPMRSTNI